MSSQVKNNKNFLAAEADTVRLELNNQQQQSLASLPPPPLLRSGGSDPDRTSSRQLGDSGQPTTAMDTVSGQNSVQESSLSASAWSASSSDQLLDSTKLEEDLGSEVTVLTKLEPVDLKSEILGRLKQEYAGTAATEGQLRELLLMTSTKTLADDVASKTLLQLSGQFPDMKTFGEDPHRLSATNGASEHSASLLGQSAMHCLQSLGSRPEQNALNLQLGQDGNLKPKKIRHKKRVNGKKICLVCGDKALAHNFDVITCESCKAFFRRNALKSQSLQRCMFQNSCTIDKNTRRFCPSCRLKKCFDIGMKAELILDDEERRLRQEKKAQRIKRQVASSSTTMDESCEAQVGSSGTAALDMDTAFSPDTAGHGHSNSFSPPEVRPHGSSASLQPQSSPLPSFQTLRDAVTQSPSTASQSSFGMSPIVSHTQPSSAEQSPFSTLLSQLSTSSPSPMLVSNSPAPQGQGQFLSQSVLAFAAKSPRSALISTSPAGTEFSTQQKEPQQLLQEEEESPIVQPINCPYPLPGPAARIFKHVPRDQLPSDPFMYWIVSGEERLVLANLTVAYQDVLLSLNERGLCRNVPISDSYFIHDFLNEIDDAMYKIVQFSKHIADFRLVRKEDQITMLKSSAMQALGIACCAVYVQERDCWLSLRGDLTLSHLRKLTNDDPYIQVGVEYCRSVKSLVKNDFTIYALVHCMILFDPRDAKIVDRQIINQTRDKYVIMLKHYLESQFSYLYADEYFVAIQERVREMCHLAQSGNALFKRYSSAFQPLITEMLSST